MAKKDKPEESTDGIITTAAKKLGKAAGKVAAAVGATAEQESPAQTGEESAPESRKYLSSTGSPVVGPANILCSLFISGPADLNDVAPVCLRFALSRTSSARRLRLLLEEARLVPGRERPLRDFECGGVVVTMRCMSSSLL